MPGRGGGTIPAELIRPSGLCRDTDVMTLPLDGRSRPASARLRTVVYNGPRRSVNPAESPARQ